MEAGHGVLPDKVPAEVEGVRELACEIAFRIQRWLWRIEGVWHVCCKNKDWWQKIPELSLEAAETALAIEALGGSSDFLVGPGAIGDIQVTPEGTHLYYKYTNGSGGWRLAR